jgi:glutathione S-transferase
MESNYKLHYFPGNMRGCLTRAILTYSGAKWEDNRVNWNDFLALQKEGAYEYGCLPVLEVDGKPLTQSFAIDIYLAKKFNLAGETDEDLYEILNLIGSREDIYTETRPLIFPTDEQKTKQAEIVESLKTKVLPYYLKVWEKKYVTKGGKFWLGEKISLADLCIAVIFESLTGLTTTKPHGFGEAIAQHAPKLHAHVENLKANELATYFKSVFNYEAYF